MPEDYVVVYVANGQLEGQMIRAFLESKGIQVVAYEESVGMTYGLTITPLGQVDIRVSEEQAEEALQILADMQAGKYEQPPEEGLPPTDSDDSQMFEI